MNKLTNFLIAAFMAATVASAAARVPEQLRGKSVVISWTEFRRERAVSGGPERSTTVPNRFILYVSSNDQVFNRLQVANHGSSDQVGGAADQKRFASRKVEFAGATLAVSNNFSSCSGNVVEGLSGHGPARQTSINGQEFFLLEAHSGPATCSVVNGNALGD
jgi:hypothetical protein